MCTGCSIIAYQNTASARGIQGGMFIPHAGMNIPIVPGGAVSKATQTILQKLK